MKRFVLALTIVIAAAGLPSLFVTAAGRFDQKLPADKQIIHVLNRMTFGPRPGDAAEVRRIGVAKWIDLQLHPERIPENAVLTRKLEKLETLKMPVWELLQKHPAVPAAIASARSAPNLFLLLPQPQSARLLNCSVDERKTLLASFEPALRHQILAAASPALLEGLPADIQQEAADARRDEQQARQKELRRLMPPLADILTPDEIRRATRGTKEDRLAFLNSLDPEKRAQAVQAMPPQSLIDFPDLRRQAMAARQPQQLVNSELIENKLQRAIYSNRQLEEVLADFWMNHFNIYNGKGPDRVLLTSFERDAIRPNVFGHFRDLLLATARHPAMLFYLDNWQSQVPRDDLPIPPGVRRPGLNENYGRELMELHTMGVNGGYTQDDVIAVTRAFSGWTIYDPQRFGEFQFNPGGHDRKDKVVLGHTIPAMGGEQDGVQVIDILARHPSTARFISRELAQRFVADDPPQSLVDRMADTFTKTDGDLRAVLQTMFTSREFMSEGAWQAKLKSPLELVVSAARALNADVTDAFALAQRIAELGEPLYGKVEPTGYPNTGEGWAGAAGLLGRINFATAIAGGRIPGVTVDVSRFNSMPPAAIASGLLGSSPSAATLDAIEQEARGKPVQSSNTGLREPIVQTISGLVLASPDFQRR